MRLLMKVFVWGTGCGTGELIDMRLSAEDVCAFVDSSPGRNSFLGRPVIRPEELAASDYDLVIVTSRQSGSIAAQAEELGIAAERMLFLRNNWTLSDRNTCYSLAEKLLSDRVLSDAKRRPYPVRDPLWVDAGPLTERDIEYDYVRVRSLEAISRRLRNVSGSAAELGVYRGSFARCINALMPERKLYLFDTFEGFAEKEIPSDAPGLAEAHRYAGLESLMKKMPHPEQIEIRKGVFPDTLDGLEERFAFVSIDVDLEQSTLEGLRWFYPRLLPGGYIMLHDHGNPALPGVKRALDRFETELGAAITAVPLCDICGTLVLCR